MYLRAGSGYGQKRRRIGAIPCFSQKSDALWVINFITLKGCLCDVNHIKIDFCDGCHIISAKIITPA
ncbi:hypothetical protein EEK96_02250 [Escherichia coli]|nr:hypothetical protein [Escherichia coli]